MDKNKIDAAIARFLETNPNPDNRYLPPLKPKTINSRTTKRVTARPSYSTRYGKGGGFKSGKGKFS